MNIRSYTTTDLGNVIDAFRSNIPKYFVPAEEAELREFLGGSPEHYYVIDRDGEVVAAGGIGFNSDDTISLCWGMVHNGLLGTGLGKMLTEFRIKLARDVYGDRPIVISTSQHTAGFYAKFGLVTIEHTPDGFGPGIDICKMRREPLP
jgi:predicted GNAT family N-acyltransferase